MRCENMKKEWIPIETPRYKAKLERNIYACKSTKYHRSLIRHNRLITMPRGLSPNMIYVVKIMGRSFCDLE